MIVIRHGFGSKTAGNAALCCPPSDSARRQMTALQIRNTPFLGINGPVRYQIQAVREPHAGNRLGGYYVQIQTIYRNTMPSIQGATVINFEDGTVCNDLDTYDIWRIDPTDRDKLDRMYADLKPGESFILPEGKYFAAMNGSEAAKKGLAPITFFSKQGKSVADFFDQEYYYGGSGYIEFNVSDGEADKELVFYVMNNKMDRRRQSADAGGDRQIRSGLGRHSRKPESPDIRQINTQEHLNRFHAAEVLDFFSEM